MAHQIFDQAKFDELVLYIVNRVENPADLGAVKLHKVLWFSDLNFFAAHGRSIAGDSYIKMPQGPFSTHAEKAIKRLKKGGRLVEREIPYFGKSQRRFFATAEADLAVFSASEISMVDRMIEMICFGHTAASISDFSHTRIWQVTPDRATIPLETVFSMTLVGPNQDTQDWVETAVTEEVLRQADDLVCPSAGKP